MNSDSIPEILYPNPKRSPRYLVVNLIDADVSDSFATALEDAEHLARKFSGKFAICKIDSTIEFISGITSVRAES